MPRRGAQTGVQAPASELLSLDQIGSAMERALAASPADETELAWLEVQRAEAQGRGPRTDVRRSCQRTILVRVIDHGRVGSHRTGSAEPGDLDNAVRMAIAQSRVREPLRGLPHLPLDDSGPVTTAPISDPELAALDPRRVRALLQPLRKGRESVRLEWSDARVAVFSSRGIRRRAAVTAAGLEVLCGRRPGAGRASGAARTLAALAPERIFERARRRHAGGAAAEAPQGDVPVVFSPEAMATLCELLNRVAFTAGSYYDGTSFLREHLGIQVFDRGLNLRDDGTDAAGLPFPFDLEGTVKQPVDLIVAGTPKTPALDQRQAALLGLPPTAHAISGSDAKAENLFVLPGEAAEQELLSRADGGLWVGWLDHLECFEPRRVQVRARMRGVRRIERGDLGPGVPDLSWQDSLLRVFSSLLGLGRETVVRLGQDGYLGGVSAPAVAVSTPGGLSLAAVP